MQRTLEQLVESIATKLEVDPQKVQRTVHVTRNGLSVLVDDDVVRELPEGQDMLVELTPIKTETVPIKRQWDSGATDAQVDGDMPTTTSFSASLDSAIYQMKLIF